MTASDGAVRLRLDGDVLHATIDRPHARNAIDHDVVAGLEAAVATARQQDVKVVVLRGAGGSFCAGADLRTIEALLDDEAALRAFLERLGAVLTSLERAPWVTLAVVEGYAVAGGCELLLACDVVVAAADARIGDRHVEHGLVPGGGSSVRLPRAVGPQFARYLLLTGELISGSEAAERGLATLAVAPERLDEEAGRIVARLRSRGRGTLATVKAMLAEDRTADAAPRLRREIDLFLAHLASAPDARVGIAAFRERVAPSSGAGAAPQRAST